MPVLDSQLYLSPQFRYVGKFYSASNSNIGDAALWNLVATSETLLPRTMFSMGLYNLLDETYYNSGTYLDVIPQMGRTALIQFSWKL